MSERSTSLKVVRCAVSCCARGGARRFSGAAATSFCAWSARRSASARRGRRGRSCSRAAIRGGEDIALGHAAILAGAGDRWRDRCPFRRTGSGRRGKDRRRSCREQHRRRRARRLPRGTVSASAFAPFSFGGGSGFRRRGGFLIDAGDDLADLHGVARLDEMLQLAGGFGDDFGGHLVGLDFKKGIAGVDVGAVGLAPDAEEAGGDGFADGGDFDFEGHKNGKVECGVKSFEKV